MFIVIDGLDGSGKGTQTKLVAGILEKMGKKVLLLDYPRYGEKSAYFVEKYLNGGYGKNVSAKLASLFFALDRFDDNQDFSQKITEYDYIISNRYVSANMIHQTGKITDPDKRREFLDWIDDLEYKICGIPRPDIVIFLDVPPDVSQKLVEKKDKRDYITNGKNKDIHESDMEHLQNTYNAAQQVLMYYPEWKKLDCCENGDILPIEIITKKILNIIFQPMDFKEYVHLAIRTESLYPVIDKNHEQKNINDSLLHSALGIQTEVGEIFEALYIRSGEIDNVNLREEIGDVMWYLAIACNKLDFYDLDFNTIFDTKKYKDTYECVQQLNYYSIEILDSFKKSLFYNKPFDTELLKNRLKEIFTLSGTFVVMLGGNLQDICDLNIKKLQARYPEKFTTERAIDRDLNLERAVLEG